MLSRESKAYLRKASLNDDTRYQIGKNGLTPQSLDMFEKALTARELIKINVMKNCDISNEELCVELCEKLKCELVEAKGNSILVFKKKKTDSRFKVVNG